MASVALMSHDYEVYQESGMPPWRAAEVLMRLLRGFCRSPRLERVARAGLFKKVVEKCKRVRQCPHCAAINGTVK